MRAGEIFGGMMTEFKLKDGREARIEQWDFNQLEDYVSRDLPTYDLHRNGRKKFNSFTFLGPHNTTEMDGGVSYSKEENLSPLEIQADRFLPNQAYHKSLAALENDNLAGILICEWINGFADSPFWHYTVKFIDVNEEYKYLGVGTNLVKALVRVDFLKGKIFSTGGFTPEGAKYIKPVFDKELKAKDYAIIPIGFNFLGGAPVPTKPGIYDCRGNLVNLEKSKETKEKSWLRRIIGR